MSSITITTQSFGAINSTVTGQAPATILLEIGTPGPQGQQGPQGNPGPAGASTWGGISGNLSNQYDLQAALDSKYLASNPSNFVNAEYVNSQGFLHSYDVVGVYQPISSMSAYALKSSPTFTGTVTIPTPATSSNTTVAASTAFVKAQGYATLASPTFTGTVTIPSGASISGYLTTSSAVSTYQTLSGMSSYLTTSSAASTYQPISGMSSYPTFTDADGRYLQLSGGAMATNSSISIAGTTYDSLMASDVFGVEKTSDSTQNASLGVSAVTINSTSSGTYGTTTNAGQVTSSALTLTQSGTDSYGTITHAGTYGLDQFTSVVSGVAFSSTLTVAGNGIVASQTNLGTTASFCLNSSGVQWDDGTVNGQFGPSGLKFADGTTQTTAYTGGGSGVAWGAITGTLSDQTDLSSVLSGKVDAQGAISAITAGATNTVTSSPYVGQILGYNGGSLQWVSPSGGGTPTYSESVWIYNNWYSATIQTVYTTSYSYVNVLTF